VFDFGRYHVFQIAVGLERCLFSLVKMNEELIERKVAAHVKETKVINCG
jgi:hypothetical protein